MDRNESKTKILLENLGMQIILIILSFPENNTCNVKSRSVLLGKFLGAFIQILDQPFGRGYIDLESKGK